MKLYESFPLMVEACAAAALVTVSLAVFALSHASATSSLNEVKPAPMDFFTPSMVTVTLVLVIWDMPKLYHGR